MVAIGTIAAAVRRWDVVVVAVAWLPRNCQTLSAGAIDEMKPVMREVATTPLGPEPLLGADDVDPVALAPRPKL